MEEINPAMLGMKDVAEEKTCAGRSGGGTPDNPLIGLSPRPQVVTVTSRAKEITDAMERYWVVGKPVPSHWFGELMELVGWR